MAKKQIVLCDTNILIELSKNNTTISKELKLIGSANIAVSAVTAGELIYGALNKAELSKIINALNVIQVIPINELISEKSLDLLKKYSLSHKLTVPDALIAATTLTYDLQFYTLNLKHFKFIHDIHLYKN